MGPLVNGAKTAKHFSELDAERRTIPILKCFVDFRGIFYVVKMSFLCLQTNVFGEIWHRAFLRTVGSVKAYKIMVPMAVNDASTCKICRGMVANGGKS